MYKIALTCTQTSRRPELIFKVISAIPVVLMVSEMKSEYQTWWWTIGITFHDSDKVNWVYFDIKM